MSRSEVGKGIMLNHLKKVTLMKCRIDANTKLSEPVRKSIINILKNVAPVNIDATCKEIKIILKTFSNKS